MSSPSDAATVLQRAARAWELDRLCDGLGIDLLGIFGSAAAALRARAGRERSRSGLRPAPHDLDVVVAFSGAPDLLGLIDRLTELTGCEHIDVLDLGRADPLARAAGQSGIGRYERHPSAWGEAHLAAMQRAWDTAPLRALDREALRS